MLPLPDGMVVNRLSVLHLLAPGAAGGLESVVRLLATGLRDRGHTVRVAGVVSRADDDHPYLAMLRAAGVETESLRIHDRAYLRERRWVVGLCRRHRPDVVHTHGFRSDVVDARAAKRLAIPIITTVHGFTGGGWRVRLYERIQVRAFRQFDAVVAVSSPLAAALAAGGVRRDRIHVVHNAYRPTVPPLERAAARRALAIAEGSFVLGWVGRLSPEKGADVVIDALALLTDVPVQVSFVGDGPERTRLRRRAESLGLRDRIDWHGTIDDAASYFRAFDALVLSSRAEGSPMVIFEAMAANVPIVATRVGGVPEILSPAEAVLVTPGDAASLAVAIRELYSDRSMAAVRAEAARKRLETTFAAAPWIARYETLYRRIRRPPTPPHP